MRYEVTEQALTNILTNWPGLNFGNYDDDLKLYFVELWYLERLTELELEFCTWFNETYAKSLIEYFQQSPLAEIVED